MSNQAPTEQTENSRPSKAAETVKEPKEHDADEVILQALREAKGPLGAEILEETKEQNETQLG